MHGLRVNPRRCARGTVPEFTPTNLGTVALFNNSSGAELLLVLAVALESTAQPLYIGFTQQKLGTVQTTAGPLMSGEAMPPGQVTKLDTASALIGDVWTNSNIVLTSTLNSPLPWAVLQPQWSFFIQDTGTGDPMGASFIWQAVHTDDLWGRPCAICWPYDAQP
jgi:hypothetical protein